MDGRVENTVHYRTSTDSAEKRVAAKASRSNGCVFPFIKNLLPSKGPCFAAVTQQRVYTLQYYLPAYDLHAVSSLFDIRIKFSLHFSSLTRASKNQQMTESYKIIIKLSLCLIKTFVMKIYWGGGVNVFYAFLTSLYGD
jgi:hypothetical protein